MKEGVGRGGEKRWVRGVVGRRRGGLQADFEWGEEEGVRVAKCLGVNERDVSVCNPIVDCAMYVSFFFFFRRPSSPRKIITLKIIINNNNTTKTTSTLHPPSSARFPRSRSCQQFYRYRREVLTRRPFALSSLGPLSCSGAAPCPPFPPSGLSRSLGCPGRQEGQAEGGLI